MRILINALGYKVLEPTVHNDPNSTVDDETLFLNLGNASGKGMVTTEGFVLFAGAVLNEKTSEKSLSKGAATLRKKHLASNKVKDFVTTEDIFSPVLLLPLTSLPDTVSADPLHGRIRLV